MKSISEYRAEVEATINNIKYPSGNLDTLYEPIKYSLSAGGKRLRPVLTLMGADAFGGTIEKALIPAIGIEIFHNFTLLHDDVMDKSEKRRGRLTVHKKYDENTAILSGDTMLTLATEFIAKVEDRILSDVLQTFNDMAIKVYEGQRLDMDFEHKSSISINDYMKMIEFKTGALLGASVMIGALIGGSTKKDAQLMYDFGRYIGIAFQIQDDWLDTFGDPATFGKSLGGDINNFKKTFLYVTGISENSSISDALKSAFEIPAGDVRVKTVTRLYEKLGITEICKKEVNRYLAMALNSMNDTSLNEVSKKSFHEFAEKLIGRKR